jgi:hypothetical protein
MCLGFSMNETTLKSILENMGDGYITVYKIVDKRTDGYYPPYANRNVPYKDGENVADTSKDISYGMIPRYANSPDTYKSGFHFIRNRERADLILRILKQRAEDAELRNKKMGTSYIPKTADSRIPNFALIECKVKRDWISTMGPELLPIEEPSRHDIYTVVVADKAIFPKFKAKA